MAQQSGGVMRVAAADATTATGGATRDVDMAAMFQSHPVATLILSAAGTVIDANQAAEQWLNRSRATVVGLPIDRLIRWGKGTEFSAMLAHPGKTVWAFAVDVSIGAEKTLLADIAIAPAGGGNENSHILAIHPVPRGARAQFRRPGSAARSASAAAAMLAHEVKNPLSGIRGAAQLLGRAQHRDEANSLSALIVREVDRIAGLIDGMQAFTRGGALPCEPINIYPPLAQAKSIAQQGFGQRVKFIEEFDPSLPFVSGNHDALVQIMINLIKNACEAAADRPDACVRLSTAYRHGLSWDADDGLGPRPLPVEIGVDDNGPGVADVIADSLFDPFVTGKRDGQGLGLALVDKLVRDMGGLVENDRAEGWTRFKIHLGVGALPRSAGDA